ncbi:MAG: hypothetical protein JWR16_1950 [Nevskia sp.]|nr:hypothetical protein [Nevskia sp.]
MEAWVSRALARWPDVPALFGWLALDRRGRWLIRGEVITRPQIVDTINRNYAADAQGRWYFQNGPQRGYIALAYAPFVLSTNDDGATLQTHTRERIASATAAYIDEQGSLLLMTPFGAGLLLDAELDWALARLKCAHRPIDDAALAAALEQPSGTITDLELDFGAEPLTLIRLDRADAPTKLGFVRDPQPSADESGMKKTAR